MKTFLFLILCCSAVHAKEVVVFAASSLTDSLGALSKTYEEKSGDKIKLVFDASSRLALQIEQGAKAELFFSADESWNTFLVKKKLVSSAETKTLLTNELVLITNSKRSFTVSQLKDLTKLSFKHIALAQSSVPAGKYALEALKRTQAFMSVRGKITSAENVRGVLAWVAKDEADLGIVFATDAKVSEDVRVLLSIDPKLHSEIRYPVSLIGGASPEAKKFYDFLQSETAKDQFEASGFRWK